MEFKTYVNTKQVFDVPAVKKALIAQTTSDRQLDEERRMQILEALQCSGGSHLASRYGLSNQIEFSDSELLSAYERGKDSIRYLNYRYEFKLYPSGHRLKDFPLVMAVEASSRCNLRCRMCFQRHMDEAGQPQNHSVMSWELYERFLHELEEHQLYSIVFASRGEPLLNPNIDRMISEAKKRGVLDIKLNTNATLLTEDMSHRLLRSGLDMIVFSVDSVNADNYRDIRGVNLDLVLNNIDRFLEIRRREYPDSTIKVRAAMVITKELTECAAQEIQKAKQYWLERVDELSVKTENDFIHIYDGEHAKISCNVCSLLWERMYLWADGKVNPCDIDHLSTMCVGDLTQGDRISELWIGEKMENLRQQHEQNRNNMHCVCANCVGY